MAKLEKRDLASPYSNSTPPGAHALRERELGPNLVRQPRQRTLSRRLGRFDEVREDCSGRFCVRTRPASKAPVGQLTAAEPSLSGATLVRFDSREH